MVASSTAGGVNFLQFYNFIVVLDNPILWTATKFPAKINSRRSPEINSHYVTTVKTHV